MVVLVRRAGRCGSAGEEGLGGVVVLVRRAGRCGSASEEGWEVW